MAIQILSEFVADGSAQEREDIYNLLKQNFDWDSYDDTELKLIFDNISVYFDGQRLYAKYGSTSIGEVYIASGEVCTILKQNDCLVFVCTVNSRSGSYAYVLDIMQDENGNDKRGIYATAGTTNKWYIEGDGSYASCSYSTSYMNSSMGSAAISNLAKIASLYGTCVFSCLYSFVQVQNGLSGATGFYTMGSDKFYVINGRCAIKEE